MLLEANASRAANKAPALRSGPYVATLAYMPHPRFLCLPSLLPSSVPLYFPVLIWSTKYASSSVQNSQLDHISLVHSNVVSNGGYSQVFIVSPPPSEDHIQSLINANHELWEDLVNHPFPRQMARGTAPLNGFRHYMIQDAIYLEIYVRVRMQAIANPKSGASSKELDAFVEKMSKSLQYAKDMRAVCECQLGVPGHIVANEPMSQQLTDAIELYERVAREGNWLDMHIALLPCIMGYYTIAAKLLLDPATVRNTLYYTLWIKENANAVSLDRYKILINDYINRLPDSEKKWDYWNDLFGKACQIEKAFFDIAYDDLTYDIISDGQYKIRSFGQNGYLVPGDGGHVALHDDPDENWTWELTNARDGYLIRNVGSGALLGVSVTERFPPFYEVNASGEGYRAWSLNPVSLLGKRVYQLFVSSKLQFTLDVDVGQNTSRVFVSNGNTGSSQMWILEAVV